MSLEERIKQLEETILYTNSQRLPVGTIQAFSGLVAPSGWLICDGSSISRLDYRKLFRTIGTIHGDGDKVNTFNLPDLRGRTLIGAGAGPGLTNRPLGTYLGEEMHLLSERELPVHSHGLTDPGHQHAMGAPTRGRVWGVVVSGHPGGYCYGVDNRGVQNNPPTLKAQTGISVEPTGSGLAHNNMQPSLAINYIIKY